MRLQTRKEVLAGKGKEAASCFWRGSLKGGALSGPPQQSVLLGPAGAALGARPLQLPRAPELSETVLFHPILSSPDH